MSEISPPLRDRGRGFCGFFVFPLLHARKHRVNKTPAKMPHPPHPHEVLSHPPVTGLGERTWGEGSPLLPSHSARWREPRAGIILSLSLSLATHFPIKAPSGWCQGYWGAGEKVSVSLRLGLWVLRKVTEPCRPHHSGTLTTARLGRCDV